MEMVSGPLAIAMDATARTNGAAGDKVRLEMPTTHRNLQAVVTAPARRGSNGRPAISAGGKPPKDLIW